MKRLLRIWRLLNLPCDEVIRLVSQSLDQELPRAERAAIRTHLVYCKACRRFRAHMLLLRDILEHYAEDPGLADLPSTGSLSPEARERIKRALDIGD